MNDKQIRNIVREYMEKMIIEQDIEISPYTPEEEKFLAKFAELKTTSIGIIYSKDTTGVREFLNRSGKDFNLTPDILHSLLKKGTVSIVPYGGYARNEDYTLQLNIPLEDLEGLSSGPPDTDKDKAIATEESVESSQELANLLVTEQKRHTQSRIYTGKSRTLKRLPKGYINYLERIIQILGSKLKNEREREQLVADILDNLAHNFGLTPKQVYRSFIYYRSQNRLANVVREHLKTDNDMIKLKELLEQSQAAAFDLEEIGKKYKFNSANAGGWQTKDAKNFYKALPEIAKALNINLGKSYELMKMMPDQSFRYMVFMLNGRSSGAGDFGLEVGINNIKKIINGINTYYAKLDDDFIQQMKKDKEYVRIALKRTGTFVVKEPKPEPQIIYENPGAVMIAENPKVPNFFPDDGATISSKATNLINNSIQKLINDQRAALPKDARNIRFGVRQIQIMAGTSKVPTKYKGTGYSDQNNITLCNDRGQAMLKTVKELLESNNIEGYNDVIAGGDKYFTFEMEPNGGDPWTDKEREDTATYGTPGNRTAAYEKKYGKARYAQCLIAFTVKYQRIEIDPGDPKVFTGDIYDVMLKVTTKSTGGGGGRKKRCRIFCNGLGFKPKYKAFKPPNTLICPAFTKRTGKKSRLNPGNRTRMGFQ